MKRLFCTDYDNTLAIKGKMRPENVQAIRRLQDAGFEFAIASGRPSANIMRIFSKYGVKGHLISNNGALTIDQKGQIVQEIPMPVAETRAWIERCEREDWRYLFYSKEICYLPRSWTRLPGSGIISSIVRFYFGMGVKSFDGKSPSFLEAGVYKMNIKEEKLVQSLYREILEEGKLSATVSGNGQVELMAPGGSKIRGVRALADHLKIPMDRVVSIGDYDNDSEMLAESGWSFAMGNGSGLAKQAAKMETAKVDEGGFVQAVDWILAHPEAGLLLAEGQACHG